MIEKLPGQIVTPRFPTADDRRNHAAGVRGRVETVQMAHVKREKGKKLAEEQIAASLCGSIRKGSKRALRSLLDTNQ